jgi:hypothetical protein
MTFCAAEGRPRVLALSRVAKDYPYIGKRPYLADRKPPLEHLKVSGASPLPRLVARPGWPARRSVMPGLVISLRRVTLLLSKTIF